MCRGCLSSTRRGGSVSMLCKPLKKVIGCALKKEKKENAWLWWALSFNPARGLFVETFCTQPKSNSSSENGCNGLSRQIPSFQPSSDPLSADVLTFLRIIGSQKWGSSLEESMSHSGISITQQLVHEILKSISEPKIALRFFLWARRQPGYVDSCESTELVSRLWPRTKSFYDFLDISDKFGHSAFKMTNKRFTVLIMGYGWMGMVDEAVDALDQMNRHGCTPDLVHYNCVLDALTKANQLNESQALYKRMLDDGLFPSVITHTIMIVGLGKAGKFKEACSHFSKMMERGGKPDLHAFTSLMSSLCKARKVKCAFEIFQAMECYGLTPDLPVYNVLLQALCQEGMLPEAGQVFATMEKEGHQPDSVVFATIVNSFFKGKKLVDAAQAFVGAGQRPNAATFAAMLSSLCKFGKVNEIQTLITEMQNSGCCLSINTYNVVITNLCREKLLYEARMVMCAMDKAGISPDVYTYTTLMKGLCMAGRMDDASQVLEDMTAHGCRPNTFCYNTLLAGLCDHGSIASADALMQTMIENGCTPNIITYNSYVRGLCKAGKPYDALNYLGQAKQLRFSPNSRTFIVVLTALCDKKDFEMAWRLFHIFIDCDAICFKVMVRRFSEANRLKQSEDLFNRMIEKGFLPDGSVYSSLISCYCRNQCLDKASKLFNLMIKNNCTPDFYTRQVLNAAFQAMKPSPFLVSTK